ncbi:uncharacterized protein [Malus domestica]|uniref:uncharacterized protein n=1 Tax=Malus domestica TaxID=3750 RepID=UPI003975A949
MNAFSTLLKLNDSDKFEWKDEHHAVFTQIKVSLMTPPILVPPRRGKPLKLYISAAKEFIGYLLAQDNDAGREQVIFYLSRNLNQPEINYSTVEKLCLTLFFTASKLRHYMLPSVTQVIAQIDVIRYMLTRPIVKDQIGKWTMALSEFSLQYVPQKAIKGQALADFLAQHPSPYGFGGNDVEIGMVETRNNYWTTYFDGSKEHIVTRFDVPETIITDNGTIFTAERFKEYTASLKIQLEQSTPYYPQANRQAKISDRDNTLCTNLGHDAMLPVELSINSLRIIEQSSLFSAEYNQSMRQELEDLEQARLDAYNLLVAQKRIVEQAYNQKVRQKTFGEGELVWQTVLPVGLKDPRFGKWSPNWEGSFVVHKVYGNGAYHLRDQTGLVHKLPINGKFLKKNYPVTWEMRE